MAALEGVGRVDREDPDLQLDQKCAEMEQTQRDQLREFLKGFHRRVREQALNTVKGKNVFQDLELGIRNVALPNQEVPRDEKPSLEACTRPEDKELWRDLQKWI